MIRLSTTKPYVRSVPKLLQPFIGAGSVDIIFRPRILGNGVFATDTGHGVSFSLDGVDSEGLDRETLDELSRKVARANRMLPDTCLLYEYLIVTNSDDLPARPIENEIVRRQAAERTKFLKDNAKFKSVRLIVTLYIPGKVASSVKDFTDESRAAIKQLQSAAFLYEEQMRKVGIRRLSPDELVQVYSYLLNLDRSLITKKAALPSEKPKKLGRAHVGIEGDYLRVGKRYGQMLSLSERPRGTRPNLWGDILTVDCEMVWCSIFQRKATSASRGKAIAVENAIGMAGGDIWSAVVGGYNPDAPPPRKASDVAAEKKVERVGGLLDDLDTGEYFGHYSLFGLIHSRDKAQVEAVLPRIQGIFGDPSEASLMEEKRGAVPAYVSCFPGQNYSVRKLWFRGDHKANLSFIYSPFLGYPWSDDLQDEYTLVYETRQHTPFFLTTFVNGLGNTIALGAPGHGKSLNANAIFSSAMKYGGKTYIFDQGGSYESNVRSLNGSVTHLGLDRPRMSLFRGEPTKDRIFASSQQVKLLLNLSGVAVGISDMDAIEKGVERLFDADQDVRRLSNLFLPPILRHGMKRWVEGGIYGATFDNVEDDLEFHDLQLFDFASLSDKHSDLLTAQTSWILMQCQDQIRDPRLRGIPKHIVMDELWKRMGLLPVLSFLLETIQADRKNLAWATLITQSAEHLGTHAQVIKNACPNTIFTGGPFDRKLYAELFNLNEKELIEIEQLQARELAIKVDGEPFVEGGTGYFKVLRMNMDPAAYARATTKASERAERDRLVAEHGAEEGMNQMMAQSAKYRGR